MTGIGNLATILSVLTGFIACMAFLAATGPGSRLIIFLILSSVRLQTVISAAKRSGLTSKRGPIYRAVREIVTTQYAGAPYDLGIELEWLCRLYRAALPITMIEQYVSRDDLECLALGYQRLAGHCRARLIFGARNSDIISQQARIADQSALFLRQHSLHVVEVADMSPEVIDLRFRGSYIKVMYADTSMECIVSPHPSRQPSVPEMLQGASPTAKPRFEGILPFLLRHRLELDGGSGRILLHLAIGEIPYSNLLSRNTFWDPENSEPPKEVERHAVSLSVIPVTSDGYVLLARRAPAAGSYAGLIGPYITGNAELRDRRGLAADRNEFGIPDLLRAACREGIEEVGIPLQANSIRILGLAQIWSREDTGIFSLLLSASLPMTADEAVQLTRYADPVEGGWEVGSEMYALSLWEDNRSVEEILRWIVSDDEIIPQAVACIIALTHKTSDVRVADLKNALASHSTRPDRLVKTLPVHRPYRLSASLPPSAYRLCIGDKLSISRGRRGIIYEWNHFLLVHCEE